MSGVKLLGPWKRRVARLRQMNRILKPPARDFLTRAGWEVRNQVWKRMAASPPPRLAESTIAKKKAMKTPAPTQSWYEWRWMLAESLDHPRVTINARGVKMVMLVSTARHPEAKVSAQAIFRFHEYGTSSHPARPILAPVMRDVAAGRIPSLGNYKQALLDRIKATLTETF